MKAPKLLMLLNEAERGSHDDIYRALDGLKEQSMVSDYTVFPFLEKRKDGQSAGETVNEILEVARAEQPDILLWVHTVELPVTEEQLEQFRALPSQPTMGYWDGDLYQGFFKPFPKHITDLCKASDTIFLQGFGPLTEALHKKGCKDIRYVPGSTDPARFAAPQANRKINYDVVMIGNNVVRKVPLMSMPGAHLRKRLVDLFTDKLGDRFAVYGNGWNGPSAKGPLPFSQQAEVYHQSRLAIGNNNLDANLYFSNRLPIAMSSGVPLLHQDGKGLDQLFSGQPLFRFKDEKEAWTIAEELLRKEQTDLDQMGQQARDFVLERFHMQRGLGYMVEVLNKNRQQRTVYNPWMQELLRENRIGIAGPVDLDRLKDHLPQAECQRPKGMGGTAVNTLILGLLDAGYPVTVYTLDREVTEPVLIEGPQLRIHIGQYRPRGRDRMKDLFAKEAKTIARFIREDPAQIIHAHWGYEFALGAIKSGEPHLITLRDDPKKVLSLQKDAYRSTRWLVNRKVMHRGKYFTVNSPTLNESLKRTDPVVPNGIPDEWIATEPKTIDGPVIKFVSLVSGWVDRKNLKTSLLAFARVRKQLGEKVEYHLAGHEYEPGGPAEKWARENDCLEGVQFHGNLEHHQVWELLDSCHVLLHPSLEESFGMALAEAMARGLVVIGGKKSGAVPWVLDDGNAGILCNVTRDAFLAGTIKKAISDPEEFTRLSQAGIDNVRNRFSSSSVTRQFLAQYEKALAR